MWHLSGGKDIEFVGEDTKVYWSHAVPIFPLKARDFCTVKHIKRLKDGTSVVVQRATDHPAAPITPDYVRGSIILGASIIEPVEHDPKKCLVTMITQLDPGGFTPAVIVNQVCTSGPIGFFKGLELAAMKSK